MTIETTLTRYYFNLSNSADADAWTALSRRLVAEGRQIFAVHSVNPSMGKPHVGEPHTSLIVEPITLDITHVFSNQWNEAGDHGRRVFDWYRAVYPNKGIIAGHFLDITDDMRALRATRHVCGYCEYQVDAPSHTFCEACLDSPYLKETDLYLLRLRPIAGEDTSRPPLSQDEVATLLPRYIARQMTGKTSRDFIKRYKERADLQAEYEKVAHAALTKLNGMLWLMDHNVSTENVIYYSHTDRFGFGWRSPVEPAVASSLLDLMTEFPYRYEIKTSEKTYQNE